MISCCVISPRWVSARERKTCFEGLYPSQITLLVTWYMEFLVLRSQERERGLKRVETIFTRALDWVSRLHGRLSKVRKLSYPFCFIFYLRSTFPLNIEVTVLFKESMRCMIMAIILGSINRADMIS